MTDSQQQVGTVIRVSEDSGGVVYHYSVSFDGREHRAACGEAIRCESVENVLMSIGDWYELVSENCCERCAESVRELLLESLDGGADA